MKNVLILFVFLSLINMSCSMKKEKTNEQSSSDEVKLITLDPGHFHAALVQKTAYPQVGNDVYVYAPEGDDLEEHLKKIEAYNSRSESPTQWNEIIYRGADFFEKMIGEKKGNVMVVSGNNLKKTVYIRETLKSGIHVLADKPMAINTDDFRMLKECFEIAEKNGLLLYDIMTERFEIASILQKEFSLIPAVYGQQFQGSPDDPGIVEESVHHFLKTVSGSPLKRPAWFFDVEQQGSGIVDVSTHLVDLVQWACFPEQIINYETDIELLDATHWVTSMTLEQFGIITGLEEFPDYLQKDVKDGILQVFANGTIIYKLKGLHAKVTALWNFTYPEGGGDTHYSILKGSKSHLIVEQGMETGFIPVLFIKKTDAQIKTEDFEKDLTASLPIITGKYPGITVTKLKEDTWQVNVPDRYHVGHEAHFGQVTENFLKYLSEKKLPDWEVPNMIAKYYTTTRALQIAKNKVLN